MNIHYVFIMYTLYTIHTCRHGDILPDGGVLVTMTPTTAQEEERYLKKSFLDILPQREDRLDLSGGFLLYEEEEDGVGFMSRAAAADYTSHQQRMKEYAHTGTSSKSLRTQKGVQNLDLTTAANMSLVHDHEYEMRMQTLERSAINSRHMVEKQSLAATTLNRYKLPIHQLYGEVFIHFYNIFRWVL